MPILTFIRHAETDYNRVGQYNSPGSETTAEIDK